MGRYFDLNRISAALPNLKGYPPAVIAFLAMKQNGVNYDSPIEYGSPQENVFLDRYFAPLGAPAGTKYFIPFSKNSTSRWVKPGYSGSTLNRARVSKNTAGNVLANGLIHPDKKTFQFNSSVVEELVAQFPKDEEGNAVPIDVLDLMAWMWRDRELSEESLVDLADEFRRELNLNSEEFGRIFRIPPDSEDAIFTDKPAKTEDLVSVLGGRLPGVSMRGSEGELITSLERHVREESGFILPDNFVRRFYLSLKSQNFVILTGKPGTGKTQFVQAFIKALVEFFQTEDIYEVFLAISPETTEVEVLGYENLSGEHVRTDLVTKFFESSAARDRRGVFFLVLDEMNLAHPDRYLARILPAIESDQKVSLPARRQEHLPSDTFIVGTANSYLDEPTRLPLSGPLRRRAHIIEMPNLLTSIVLNGSPVTFQEAISKVAGQAVNRIIDRSQLRGQSFLDDQRQSALEDVAEDPNKLGEVEIKVLSEICATLAVNPITALTMGILQDAVEYVALSGQAEGAIDEALVQKVLPQVRGPLDQVEALVSLLEGFGNLTLESLAYVKLLLKNADPVTREVQPLV